MFASKDVFLTPPSGAYTIGKSVRLRSSASAYLSKTYASAGNTTTFTWSAWVKRGSLSSTQYLFWGGNNCNFGFGLVGTDDLSGNLRGTGGTNYFFNTSAVFRDPSAWYHIVWSVDTTQATDTNRLKLYVNGVQQTLTATYPPQNTVELSTAQRNIGAESGRYYFDGYLTEINFIDGQALTPSSFGSTNALTGVWQPAKYTGTYGTNGFYLNFSSNGTAAALGTDFSGNSNTWTVNNVSVTAGSTYDSMVDSPTMSAVSSNYAVMNPLIGAAVGGVSYTISQGNIYAVLSAPSTNIIEVPSTMALPTTGQWYWEVNVVSVNTSFSYPLAIGISDQGGIGNGTNFTNNYYYYVSKTGNKYSNGTATAYGATFTANDVIGVAFDAGAGTLTFYKNNTSQGTAFTGLSGTFYPKFGSNDGSTFAVNFGQRPFTYTPPTGFVALNTQNLPDSTIKNGAGYMAATLYTGNGSTQSISNAGGFQPDLVWVKGRSVAYSHGLYDSVRGATKRLISNLTNAEDTLSGVTAFNSGGFSLGSDINFNENASTYVGWQWKAGGSSSSNTNGSITSTVSVGATQGFSVVTYTGTGANATVGHGLGVAPNMIIFKDRTNGSRTTDQWPVYHSSLGATQQLYLYSTIAVATASVVFNNTAPTSSVFSIGTWGGINFSTDNYVAYCFAAVTGFSKAFSYTGNGSTDGSFVYLGFRPRMVLLKRTDTTGNWYIWDTSRNTYNVVGEELYPNLSNAGSTATDLDILSNGFKMRNTTADFNANGGTYIGFAWAENPFKLALAR